MSKKIAQEKYEYKDIGKNMFIHCAKCLKELPSGESPQSYCSFEITGYTPKELKENVIVVWCKRHKLHVWDSRHLKHRY